MKLKIFQLNIQNGRMLREIIEYCRIQDFDIVHFQEVSGGELSKDKSDNFSVFKDALSMEGILAVGTHKAKDPSSYYGNATFYKSSLDLVSDEVIWLKPFSRFDRWEVGGDFSRNLPRNAIALQFKLKEKYFWSINTHLAWGPTPHDEPYKVNQVKVLEDFIKKIREPFVLTGDFNITKNSEIIRRFDKLAINHSLQTGLKNTLNPNLHRVKELFPLGLAVDFIYTSFGMEANSFDLVNNPDLSDHYGLRIVIDL